jgi:hypothetical protein
MSDETDSSVQQYFGRCSECEDDGHMSASSDGMQAVKICVCDRHHMVWVRFEPPRANLKALERIK